jgi:hypothetical protein
MLLALLLIECKSLRHHSKRELNFMKNSHCKSTLKGRCIVRACVLAMFFCFADSISAQVNSGSNGSDGAFNPATNTVINMVDHPNGIYQYTSVNISNGVTVTFIPNANNTPVTWLVQGNCEIDGTVDVSGQNNNNSGIGGLGGPGGGAGGSGGTNPNDGQGPGGGGSSTQSYGSGGTFGTLGGGPSPGSIYGNSYLLPLLGGSGGGGSGNIGAGGGGGAILIAASNLIRVNGSIFANGGTGPFYPGYGISGVGGSGGGIRLVTLNFTGSGQITANGVKGSVLTNGVFFKC